MPPLRIVLAIKGAVAIVALGLPTLFLPLEAFQLAGFPEYSEPSSFFIRLTGGLAVSVGAFQIWSGLDAQRKTGGAILTIAECTLTILVVWHYVFYGDMATWPIRGKLLVGGLGCAQLAFIVAIIVTGFRDLFPGKKTGDATA